MLTYKGEESSFDHTKIDRLYLNQPRDELLKIEFKYGNFSFGLLNSEDKTFLINVNGFLGYVKANINVKVNLENVGASIKRVPI